MADASLSIPVEDAPLPPVDVEEAALPAEAEGSSFNLTVEDVPELSDRQVGDEVTFKISDISEDGNYSLIVSPIAQEAAVTEEVPLDGAPAAGGQEAVLEQLIG